MAPDDPREWLNRARGNLALARTQHPDIYLEDLCFNAQQAAEKALKGLLLAHGATFPYIHVEETSEQRSVRTDSKALIGSGSQGLGPQGCVPGQDRAHPSAPADPRPS